MIDFIILGQVPGTEIFINFTVFIFAMIVGLCWYSYRHHAKEKQRKQSDIANKTL